MADDFDWAERRHILTSFFFSTRTSVHSASQCQPSWAGFHLASWVVFFPFFFFHFSRPLLRTVYRWEPTGRMGTEECLLRTRREGRTCQKGVDLRGPRLVGCHHSALASAAQRSQAVPEEQRTSRPLIVPSGLSSRSWIPFAVLILRRLVCADWPLWILD